MKKHSNETDTEKISNHEDYALKVMAQFFQDEIMPALNIEGQVVGTLPTEGIHLELKKGFEDFNYLMSDGTIKHFEFQSSNEGIAGLKRFRMYESQMSYQHKTAVTTYVLFSGNIKKPMTEFQEGINTYRIVPIIMRDRNANEVIEKLTRKVNSEENITKVDLLPLVLMPLMGGTVSLKERISAAYKITHRITNIDEEVIRKVEAVIYVMADKFLNSAEMEQLKEEIKMTKLGQMLYDDGKAIGIAEGKAEGKVEGMTKIMQLIRCMSEDGNLEYIPKLATDPDFYQAMVVKYNIEI